MALHHDTQIYAAVVELGKFVLQAVRQMPRDVKLLLGGTLRDEVLWMGVLVLRMNIKNYVRDGTLDKDALCRELGDVLYYLTAIARAQFVEYQMEIVA